MSATGLNQAMDPETLAMDGGPPAGTTPFADRPRFEDGEIEDEQASRGGK